MLRMISESAAAAPRGKTKRQQAVLTVQDKTQVSKNLVRLCLGGSDYVKLNRNSCTDAYVKLLLPHPGSGLAAPFDMDRLRIEAPELLPARRTYTVRRWDDANERLWIDVVVHNAPGQHGALHPTGPHVRTKVTKSRSWGLVVAIRRTQKPISTSSWGITQQSRRSPPRWR